MAEAQTEDAVVEPAPVVEPIVDAPVVEEEDRGDQDVYQRKSHQAVKKLEGELANEREARIRLEEQVKFLAQAKNEPAKTAKIFTVSEVQDAIDAGTVKAGEGAAYLARIEAQRVIGERDVAAAARQPIDRALAEISEHRKYSPWVDDKTDPRRKQVEAEYRRLVSYGHPADERSELIALEKVAGSLDAQKKRHEMANLTRSHSTTHSETSNGGGGDDDTKVDLSKATPWQKRMWENTKTPLKARAEELRISQAMKAGKRVV